MGSSVLNKFLPCASMQKCNIKILRSACSISRNYATKPQIKEREQKFVHPFKEIHPWKSLRQFSKDLIDNIIYNKDGIVVLNKPYGISNREQPINKDLQWKPTIGVSKAVDYTLQDALPTIAEKLGYTSLTIVKSPEKYISGIAILTHDEKREALVRKSLLRTQGVKSHARTYWVVTTRLPTTSAGHFQLGLTKQKSPCETYKQPVFLNSWAKNEVERGNVKVFNVEYEMIGKSADDLASLVEIKCSMTKWHAIRVFASTILLSPILGDNIHGSRARSVMGTYLNISPFSDAAKQRPKLNKNLLDKLKLKPGQEVLIPTHIHLKEMWLPALLDRKGDLTLRAPAPPSFQWTCEQLQFQFGRPPTNILSNT